MRCPLRVIARFGEGRILLNDQVPKVGIEPATSGVTVLPLEWPLVANVGHVGHFTGEAVRGREHFDIASVVSLGAGGIECGGAGHRAES